jgi:hypothetical protein
MMGSPAFRVVDFKASTVLRQKVAVEALYLLASQSHFKNISN